MQNDRKQSHFFDDIGATPVRRNGRQLSGDDERIMLNVGGVRHETHVATLRTITNTRLARLAERHVLSENKKDEYFFDRHPAVFNSVIDYYRTGELHVPLEVCGAVVKRELDFWQVDQHAIKSCCWRHYRSYIENKRILDSFNRSLKKEQFSLDLNEFKGWKKFQMKVWLILEHPRTSKTAMLYGVVSLLFVVVSILGFCLETLPQLRPRMNLTMQNGTSHCNGEKTDMVQDMTPNEGLYILDIICTVYFTIELIVRFTFAPHKARFVRSAMNIIDLLALVPLYMQLIFNADEMRTCYVNEQLIIEIMFVLRIVRMFRIFHLVKHYQALKILVYALKASVQELLMLAIFLIIGMLVFASMIYYAERKDLVHPSDKFNTIPMGFWWAIITMTTVGYGDVYPTTPAGYVVGTGCAVCGVLLIALTIPVISNNFTLFYTHVRSKGGKEGHPLAGSRETLVVHSEEDGVETTLLDEKRKLSNGSLVVEAYMNGTSAIRKFTRNNSPQYSPILRKIAESNSMSEMSERKKENGEFDLCRTNSDKARSDDGVTYSGETIL